MPASPEVLFALSPTVLRALLTIFGPVPGLGPNASHPAIVRALFETRAKPRLARALDAVARFAPEPGRRAIIEAAQAVGDPRAEAFLKMPAADVAATLVMEAATAKGSERRAAERLLALAELRLERELAERPTYELIALRTVAREAIEAALRKTFGARLVEVWLEEARQGSFRVAAFLHAATTTRLVNEGGRLQTRVEDPITVDLLDVRDGGARVSCTLAIPELLPSYARALRLSLQPSLSLRRFHDASPASLARVEHPAGVQKVTVIARRRRRPDGSRQETRAFDALDPAHEGTGAQSGYVDRLTLRVLHQEQRIDAFVQLPHRLEISHPAFDGVMREVLAQLGTFEPGAMPDDSRSLAPYVHGDWRWCGVIAEAGFASLVARNLLVRVTATHVVTEAYRMHGAGYVVRDVTGPGSERGLQYALAEDRSLGARLVQKKDRVAWRLDCAALASAMRRDLGADEVKRPAAIVIEGVLDLGLVALPSGRIRFVYAMGTPPKGWLAVAVRACGIGITLVVFVPRGHAAEVDGAVVIELDVEEQFGVRGVGRALGKAAEALGVAQEVEAWRLCEEDLVIDAKRQQVWILGVLVPLTEKPYRFLEYLARRGGQVTTTKELGGYTSSSAYPDVAARRTRGELEKQVTSALTAAGVGAEIALRLIETDGRKGYRLGVRARLL